MADPDFELRLGPGFGLLALPAFLPSVISSFFTQNKDGGGGAAPLGPSLRSATGLLLILRYYINITSATVSAVSMGSSLAVVSPAITN